MREITGDIWDYYGKPNTIVCITTNGIVKANGELVMGRGVAKQARDRFPGLGRELGTAVQIRGNIPFLGADGFMTFPVKYDWRDKADLSLIRASAASLAVTAHREHYTKVAFILPRPGCGNGGLEWADVKPVIEPLLPDNVLVIDLPVNTGETR